MQQWLVITANQQIKPQHIMVLNVYFVERASRDCSYEQYKNFVIVCKDEATARKTDPEGHMFDPSRVDHWNYKNNWVNVEDVDSLIVTHVGVACAGIKQGIVTTHYVYG
jgi:hypothetical protein